MSKKMTRTDYILIREFYRSKGQDFMNKNEPQKADYYVGVVRGLDLVFGEGSAKTILD